MPLKPLKQGQNYKIVYQIPAAHRKPRVAIMTFIAAPFIFSLRPLAGTQEFEESWIIAIKPTDEPVATEQMWKYGES